MPPQIRQPHACLRSVPQSRSYHPPVVSYYERHHLIPPYPYGSATQYKQRDTGLYGNAQIQYGNNVSERNEIKTRRVWRPNIHHKRLWSNALQQFLEVKVQARVLRTIDKVGGLDEYLLGEKTGRIKELGVEGWALKWKILQTKAVQERLEKEREGLGLPKEGWNEHLKREQAEAKIKASEAAMKYVKIEDKRKKVAKEVEERSALQGLQAEAAFKERNTNLVAVLAKEVEASVKMINEDLRAADMDLPPLPGTATMVEDSSHPQPSERTSPLPMHPPRPTKRPTKAALLTKVESLARKVGTPVSAFLEEARQTLAEKAAEKAAASERRLELQKPRRQRREEALAYEFHPEIENAIKTGTAQVLYQKYRTQRREESDRLRRQRETEVRTTANRILTRMKRGEGMQYIKRTAWDTAYKRASKRVGAPKYVSARSVAGLTIGQWLRLREGIGLEEKNKIEEGNKGSVKIEGAGKRRVKFSDWWEDVKRNLVAKGWLRERKESIQVGA
ncbi:MAG: hypothetical protein Q9217_002988 [Psora testacea]